MLQYLPVLPFMSNLYATCRRNMRFKNLSILNIVKILVSISILSFLIYKMDWGEVLRTASKASMIIIAGAILLSVFERILVTYKWAILLWVRGMKISFLKLFSINMIGSFFGLVLPSSLSTDAVRGYMLYKRSYEKVLSASSVIIDRFLALIALLVLSGISFLMLEKNSYSMQFSQLFLVVFPMLFCCIYLIQSDKTFYRMIMIFDFKFVRNLRQKIYRLRNSIVEYKKFPKTLLICFMYSLAVQLVRVCSYLFIARGYNFDISIIYFLIYVPIIIIVVMIPISVGGLGVREGTFVTFFTSLGFSTSDAVMVAFTSSLITNVLSLSGGVFYIFNRSIK